MSTSKVNKAYFSAQFESSASDSRQCPESIAEVAFAGRSNAGKSSAINTLTRNGKLARTSKTPGRTQLINHFSLGEGRYLVDLPGYGYAQVSKSRQKAWQRAMTHYLVSRDALCGLVLVMDIRHPLTEADWQLIEIQQQGESGLHILRDCGCPKGARGGRRRGDLADVLGTQGKWCGGHARGVG